MGTFGLVDSQVKIVVDVERRIFPDGGAIVVNMWVSVCNFRASEDGAVGVELEDAEAVFYYFWGGV